MNKITAICATCGTTEQNPNDGYCKKGHDDWLEARDFVHCKEQVERAINNLKMSGRKLLAKFSEGLTRLDRLQLAKDEIREYSSARIFETSTPFAKNHLYAVRGAFCDFAEKTDCVMFYLNPLNDE